MQPARRVLIIGAGIAGLTAALELRHAGLDVILLEARRRPGGRVLTLRSPFVDGAYAEAGARYVLSGHQMVLQYCRELSVALDPLPLGDDQEPMLRFFVHGRIFRARSSSTNVWPQMYAITAEECGVGRAGLHAKYLASTLAQLGDPRVESWSQPLHAGIDALSFRDFLVAQGASEGASELMSLGTFDTAGDGIDEVSALAILRRQAVLARASGDVFTVRGGSDQLPFAMARALAPAIRYGCNVRRIIQHADTASVLYERGSEQETLSADVVVCALPFSVLRNISVEPAFDVAKSQIVSQMPHSSVCRVYLQCRERFWAEAQDLELFMATDLPIMHLYRASAGQAAPSAIIEAYMVGPRARHVSAMQDAERIEFTLAHVERIFPSVRSHFICGVSYCWDLDPWAQGAFPWFRPGQLTQWAEKVGILDGHIHFAGDQTSVMPGWMEGAMQSGRRVAREIILRH